ncbi:MAG: PfkB family carbohydrate kinase [Armatimonadota bacterium]|nr:PfkB family carbohydrate kinase [Armatimonadota bacterium]
MAEVVCLGEALIDMVAQQKGVTISEARGFSPAPGGAPANVAVGVAKLGVRSAFLGKVGADPFGYLLRDTLHQHGVDVGGMRFDTQARTALAFVSLTKEGVPDFIFYRNPSADMLYEPGDVDTHRVRLAKIFHFGSISLLDEPVRSATLFAVQMARENGALISYDPNMRPALWRSADEGRERMETGLRYADVVKLNETELEFLTGASNPEVGATHLFLRFPQLMLVAVTLGERGCYYATPQHSGAIAGIPVNVVETVGCGDAFVAGMLVQLRKRAKTREGVRSLSDADLRRVFLYANAAGAITATRAGAIPALPTDAEVADLLTKV